MKSNKLGAGSLIGWVFAISALTGVAGFFIGKANLTRGAFNRSTKDPSSISNTSLSKLDNSEMNCAGQVTFHYRGTSFCTNSSPSAFFEAARLSRQPKIKKDSYGVSSIGSEKWAVAPAVNAVVGEVINQQAVFYFTCPEWKFKIVGVFSNNVTIDGIKGVKIGDSIESAISKLGKGESRKSQAVGFPKEKSADSKVYLIGTDEVSLFYKTAKEDPAKPIRQIKVKRIVR